MEERDLGCIEEEPQMPISLLFAGERGVHIAEFSRSFILSAHEGIVGFLTNRRRSRSL